MYTKEYILNAKTIDYSTTDGIRQYNVVSEVTIEYLDNDRKTFKMTINDIQTSTNNPSDLYSGILIGNCKALSGNEGYPGTASIKDNVFLYTEPNYDRGNNNVNYWLSGKLTPKCNYM